MIRLFTAALLVLSLAGCTTFNNLENAAAALTSASVNPTLVIVAGNSFDALEATATQYLRLPRCTGANGPVCRSPQATAQIIPAIRAGRVARNNLEQFMQDNPGSLGPQGLYDALTAATSTLQSIIAQYNIGATK